VHDEWDTLNNYFQGTGAADHFDIRYFPDTDSVQIIETLFTGTTTTYTLPRAGLAFINLEMLGGDDSIDFDLTGSSMLFRHDANFGAKTLNILGGTVGLQTFATVVGNLSIASAATLDLTTSSLIFQPPAAQRDAMFASLLAWVRSGRNGGNWNGPGIASSSAAAGHAFGLALVKNDPGDGNRLLTVYHGQGVDLNSIILSYIRNGDTNLDDLVNADDYARLDQAFANHNAGGYYYGDFDYSGGPPNADDYFLIDQAFFDASPLFPAPAASAQASPAKAKVSKLTARKLRRKVRHHPRLRSNCLMFRCFAS
jgi:hypothetical protein